MTAEQRVVQPGRDWHAVDRERTEDEASILFLFVDSAVVYSAAIDEAARRDDVEAGAESGSEAADSFAEIGTADVGVIDGLDRRGVRRR